VRQQSGLLGLIGVILLLFAGVALALTQARGSFDLLYITVQAVVGVLLLIAYLSSGLDNLRDFLGQRSTRYGTSTILASVFFVGILAAVNYLSTRHHHRFDLTEARVFSLSPQSAQVVKNLADTLELQAFVEGGASPELRDLLQNFASASSNVSFEMVDPDRRPELAERHKITAYNTVRVSYGEQSTNVTQPTEENLTNAIIKLTRASQDTVCVVEGHAEPDIDDLESARGLAQAKSALENENYQVKKILLATIEKVPEDCSLVLVAGPERPYLEHELSVLDAYLRGGGRAFLLLAPQRASEFIAFLKPWGVRLGDDVVVDQVLRLFAGPALGLTPLVDTYDPAHEITREIKGRTIFPMTRSVTADADGKAGLQVTEIVNTSPSSWAETDLAGIFERQQATLDPDDRRGPVPVVVAVEADLQQMATGNGQARLVVFGSVEFANNQHLDGTYFNRDLFLNAAGWLVGQADLLSIRSRSIRASRVNFSQEEGTVIFYLSVLVVPQLLLILGLVVWWRRE
jgi:ABC-type uncharacterized transport system involved in gliding motility auxiliary subunit